MTPYHCDDRWAGERLVGRIHENDVTDSFRPPKEMPRRLECPKHGPQARAIIGVGEDHGLYCLACHRQLVPVKAEASWKRGIAKIEAGERAYREKRGDEG